MSRNLNINDEEPSGVISSRSPVADYGGFNSVTRSEAGGQRGDYTRLPEDGVMQQGRNEAKTTDSLQVPKIGFQSKRRNSSATLLDPYERDRIAALFEDLQSVQSFEEGGRAGAVRRWPGHEPYHRNRPRRRRRPDDQLSTHDDYMSMLEELTQIGGEMPEGPDKPTGPWWRQVLDVTAQIGHNFLGHESPNWYKITIIIFLIINVVLYPLSPTIAGWVVVAEFIFTLTMSLKCYPLEPGGLIAIEVVVIGMTDAESVFEEIESNLEVILLLVFMVAATHFLKKMLLFVFSQLLLYFTNKIALSLAFQLSSAFLSAFLDALTVTAVLIAVIMGLYDIYQQHMRRKHSGGDEEAHQRNPTREEIEEGQEFVRFLRDLIMHAILGTALGGGLTAVGEPQNLIIADDAGWSFGEYFFRLLPVTLPVMIAGLLTLFIVEKFKIFGFGAKLPDNVRKIISDNKEREMKLMDANDQAQLSVQAMISLFIVVALALQLAAVGIIGLAAIILVTSFNGIVEEEELGKAFQDALPFTALLCVFFAIVSMIENLELFRDIINFVIDLDDFHSEVILFYLVTGVLSMISDNVFVATIYINELIRELEEGNLERQEFEILAVAVNSGTNVLSVATPNGQAAFLFLLTSSLAPCLDLTYFRMVFMALPYTITMSLAGFVGNFLLLEPLTELFGEVGLIVVRPDNGMSETSQSFIGRIFG